MPHTSTGESPHFIIFGEDKALPAMINKPTNPVYNEDFVTHHNNLFKIIHEEVKEKLTLSKHEMLKRSYKPGKIVKMKVGDIVFARIHDRADKLEPVFEGPYRITSIHNNTAIIKHLHTGKESRCSTNHLKLLPRYLGTDQYKDVETSPSPQPVNSNNHNHNYNLRSRSVNNVVCTTTTPIRHIINANRIHLNNFYN